MGIRSWWNMLRGRPPAQADEDAAIDTDAPARRVATRQVRDGLAIHEYHHAAFSVRGPFPVRTFMTEGLAALEAREVRATVPAGWDDPAIAVVGKLFSTLHQLAADGRPAMLAGWSGFQASGLSGGALIGVTYARGTPVLGIPGADAALVAVLLHPEELELVQQGLMTRVLGRLATKARHFPYPPCWEVRTTPVFRMKEQAESLLARMPLAGCGDLRVTVEESNEGAPAATVCLSLAADDVGTLAEIWSDATPSVVALAALLSPDADGQATWVPGQTERTANTCVTAPRRLGYAFLTVAFIDDSPAMLRYIEDGVGLILPEAARARLREALASGEALELPIDGESRLVLELRSEGRETYQPAAPRSQTGPVKIDRIVLLLPDDELRARVEVATLTGLITSVEQILERVAGLHPMDAPTELAIGLTLAPEQQPRVQLAYRGVRQDALLITLAKELEALAPVPVRGEVPFRIEATIQPIADDRAS